MKTNKLTKTLRKVTAFVNELEAGIEQNNGQVLGKLDEVAKLEADIESINQETSVARKLLAQLK